MIMMLIMMMMMMMMMMMINVGGLHTERETCSPFLTLAAVVAARVVDDDNDSCLFDPRWALTCGFKPPSTLARCEHDRPKAAYELPWTRSGTLRDAVCSQTPRVHCPVAGGSRSWNGDGECPACLSMQTHGLIMPCQLLKATVPVNSVACGLGEHHGGGGSHAPDRPCGPAVPSGVCGRGWGGGGSVCVCVFYVCVMFCVCFVCVFVYVCWCGGVGTQSDLVCCLVASQNCSRMMRLPPRRR